MIIWVTEAEYRGDYRVYVKFNDGTAGEVDLAPEYLYEQVTVAA